MPAALSGIRVVEITRGIAGPLAAMLLADFGAEVVRVEVPGNAGDTGRPGFPLWNRGKTGIALDPAQPADQDRLRDLLEHADLCVSVPTLAEQWAAADPQAATALNPRLVYLSMPPYLETTPWAGGQESNSLLSAAMGTSMRQSSFSGGPVDPVYPHLLYVQAVWAATCALAALFEREQSGAGQVVTVGGVHASQAASLSSMIIRPGQPDPNTAVGPGGPSSNYTRYQCADGRWVFIAALLPKFQLRALEVLGFTDLLERAITEGPAAVIGPSQRAVVRPRFEAAFASRTSEEWLATFKAADVPIAPVLERDHWLEHPQIEAIGMAASVTDPDRGDLLMPASPVHFSATPARAASLAPRAGAADGLPDWNGTRPAASADQPAAAADQPPAKAGPLAGIRVVDVGVVLAGPYAGTLLAELGADVVKVEVPDGDPFRVNGYSYIRGQRGIALDLRSPRGKEVFADFVRPADIVIDNYRPGVADRLGVSYDHVRKVTPDIISMSITAFGESGPLRDGAGFDTVLQAMCGVMSAQGGDSEPVTLSLAINDTATALLTAFGACVALVHRARGGTGQRGTLSLAASSVYMQSEELVRMAGRPEPLRGGADFPGPGPADRFYPTADGWMRIQATTAAQLAALTELAGLPATTNGDAVDGEKLQAALEAYLAALPGAQAQAELTAAGVPAVVARRVSQLRDDPQLLGWEIHQAIDTNLGGQIYVVGRMAGFSRTQRGDALIPPGVGQHTRQLLAEAGYDEAAIDALIEADVVRTGEPMLIPDVAPYR